MNALVQDFVDDDSQFHCGAFASFKRFWVSRRMSAMYHIEFTSSTPSETHRVILQQAMDLLDECVGSPIFNNDKSRENIRLVAFVFTLYCTYSMQLSLPKYRFYVDPTSWSTLIMAVSDLSQLSDVSVASKEALTMLCKLENEGAFVYTLGGVAREYRAVPKKVTNRTAVGDSWCTFNASLGRWTELRYNFLARLEANSIGYTDVMKKIHESRVDKTLLTHGKDRTGGSGGIKRAPVTSFLRSNRRPNPTRVNSELNSTGETQCTHEHLSTTTEWFTTLRSCLTALPSSHSSKQIFGCNSILDRVVHVSNGSREDDFLKCADTKRLDYNRINRTRHSVSSSEGVATPIIPGGRISEDSIDPTSVQSTNLSVTESGVETDVALAELEAELQRALDSTLYTCASNQRSLQFNSRIEDAKRGLEGKECSLHSHTQVAQVTLSSVPRSMDATSMIRKRRQDGSNISTRCTPHEKSRRITLTRNRRMSIASSTATESDAELAELQAELKYQSLKSFSSPSAHITKPCRFRSKTVISLTRRHAHSVISGITESDEELKALEGELKQSIPTQVTKVARRLSVPKSNARAKSSGSAHLQARKGNTESQQLLPVMRNLRSGRVDRTVTTQSPHHSLQSESDGLEDLEAELEAAVQQ